MGLGERLRYRCYQAGAVAGLVRIARNWPELLLYHIGLLGTRERLARLRNGLVFRVRRRNADLSMMVEIIADRYYAVPAAARAIIDIGAHVGFFALEAARQAPGATIYAYEPFPENYVQLEKNLRENRLRNVRTFNLAVADKPGTLPFYPVRSHSGCHSLYVREGAGRPIKVPVTTLDAIFAEQRIRRCDLLKLDCEGAEFPILLGASPATLRRIDRIAMEYHDYLAHRPLTELTELLEREGFRVRIVPERSFLGATRRRERAKRGNL